VSQFGELFGNVFYDENSERVRTKGFFEGFKGNVACGLLDSAVLQGEGRFIMTAALPYHECKRYVPSLRSWRDTETA